MSDKDMNNVVNVYFGSDQPAAGALITAIENDIAAFYEAGKLTPVEVLGILDYVSKQFHKKTFGE